MPMFMLNGNQYGGNGGNYQVARMSKADYDALTDEQKNDGTLRIVVDSAGNSVNYMSAQVAGAKTDDTLTNLLDPTLESGTYSGGTITNNGDGTYTANGHFTAQPFLPLCSLSGISGKYKFCGCPQGGGFSSYNLAYSVNRHWAGVYDIGEGIEIDMEASNTYLFVICIRANVTVPNNLLFKPMLTPDLQATYDDFVGYTGGTGRLNSDVAAHQKEISRINSDLSDSGWVKFDNTHNAYYRKKGEVVTIKCEETISAHTDLALTTLPFSIPHFETDISASRKIYAYCNNGSAIYIGNSDSASHNFIFCYTTLVN